MVDKIWTEAEWGVFSSRRVEIVIGGQRQNRYQNGVNEPKARSKSVASELRGIIKMAWMIVSPKIQKISPLVML